VAVIKIKRGFTLIELAIALAIIGLLLGGLSVPLSKRLAEQQYAETQASIDKAMEALVGFAMLNQRLPCPDISTTATDNRDGLENTADAAGTCITGADTGAGGFDYTLSSDAAGASWGDLPWKTLGLSPPSNADAWNNRLRYAVVSNFAMPASNYAALLPSLRGNIGTASNTLEIYCGTAARTPAPGCIASSAYLMSNDVAFVVYSAGANGWGASSISSLSVKTPFTVAQLTFAPDEAVNAPEKKTGSGATAVTSRKQFLTRERTESVSVSGAYDDLLSYMPRAKLAAKLTTAGLYP
jgi:prepilin-type N-terminal cleavage/methylation domain-containing protein